MNNTTPTKIKVLDGGKGQKEQYTERVEGETLGVKCDTCGHLHQIPVNPTTSTSTTIDEQLLLIANKNLTYSTFDDRQQEKAFIKSLKAAYNLRDKEQAGAVEIIKARINNYELEAMHDILSPTGIKNNKIRITELTNLLKEIQK